VRWSAYESPSGESLRARIERSGPATWSELRHWLQCLSEELAESIDHADLPRLLSVDRIWLGAQGDVRLMPFPARPPASELDAHDGNRWPEFVAEFATFCLGDTHSVPEHARRLLEELRRLPPDSGTARRLIAELADSENRRATVGRGQRLRHLVWTYSLLWVLGGIFLVTVMAAGGWRLGFAVAGANALTRFVLPVALLGTAFAFVVRGGPAMRLFGMELRDSNGHPASRWRSGFRALVAWSPILFSALPYWVSEGQILRKGLIYAVAYSMGSVAGRMDRDLGQPAPTDWLGALLFVLFVAGVIVVLRRPDRGWQDRIAGTRVVPR